MQRRRRSRSRTWQPSTVRHCKITPRWELQEVREYLLRCDAQLPTRNRLSNPYPHFRLLPRSKTLSRRRTRSTTTVRWYYLPPIPARSQPTPSHRLWMTYSPTSPYPIQVSLHHTPLSTISIQLIPHSEDISNIPNYAPLHSAYLRPVTNASSNTLDASVRSPAENKQDNSTTHSYCHNIFNTEYKIFSFHLLQRSLYFRRTVQCQT
jgi:hypothetical protein